MNTKSNLMRGIALLFGMLLVTAASADGKWVKLTKDFDRNIPFMKIKGADAHASVGTIKIWYDDELVNGYKKQQEEAAEARGRAEEDAKAQAIEQHQQMSDVRKSALEWIKSTYDKALNGYNEMSDESDSNNEFDESQYFTANFNRVLNVCKMAEKRQATF